MNKQSRGLGRGLEALIPTMSEQEVVKELLITDIVANKYQPRNEFNEEALEELAESINQYGLLQPVIVRKVLNGYELIAGERRWRAAQKNGAKTIPAIVREYSDIETTEIALIENLQRENLNAIEEAGAYQRLVNEFGLTQEELAKKIGRSRSHIANFIRLLNLPEIVQEYVSRGTLTMGQVRPLLTLESEDLQIEAAEYIIAEDLSARDAEKLVKKLMKDPQVLQEELEEEEYKEDIFVVEAEDVLKMALGTKVKIKPGKKKSKIEIEFYSADDLERLVEVLTNPKTVTNKFKGNLIV
ncbi:MAG: ParB/RepB/Spo0J family partition protein [Negativicutes bacterium]|jgi:ParB family chromosome partitioning protein|nr:ParB/RepB/Spo0J family partition protein [Negativicutes bacterium]MBP8629121.1 ParB/RepB/Spo0J family partition protein [Negativicutes bacterium]MBP9949326.1 ParB/RepB/Spo0J family partition protein [Negativicutes bacterium]